MGESNGDWGALVEHDPAMAEAWDSFEALPTEPGVNDALDAFCKRKNIDIPALMRTGAKLRTPTELAFSFGTTIKYRDMVSDARGGYRGGTARRLKILMAQRRPPEGIIIVEGETDAARITQLYPECDVGLMGAGALTWTDQMSEQVAGYGRILVGLDNDKAGERGSARILERVPRAQRFAPPKEAGDWCDVLDGADIPDLPDPIEAEQVGSIVFEDLEPWRGKELDPPDWLIDGVLYERDVHWIDGAPGSGKTSLCLWWAKQLIEQEKHVIWIDWEGGIQTTLRKLAEVEADFDHMVQYFHYAWAPSKPEEHIDAMIERWPGALLVLDSASKALASAGLDENSNSEVTSWTVKIIRGAKQNNVPIVVIDHVTKNNDKSMYARGAGAKTADADMMWRVQVEDPFSRDVRGHIILHRNKDRNGVAPFNHYYDIGGREGLLDIFKTVKREKDGVQQELADQQSKQLDPNSPAI